MDVVNSKSALLLILLVVLLGAGTFFVLNTNELPPQEPETIAFDPSNLQRTTTAPRSQLQNAELPVRNAEGYGVGEATSVLWPLEVAFELERAADLPGLSGLDTGGALGAGATARLEGRVGRGVDDGAQATVTFVAGPNQGRVLTTDSEGRFGATDLLPGLGIVDIQGPGLVGALREVRLRQRSEALLNIGFGRLGNVQGFVHSGESDPVDNAIVTVDGHATRTDPEGYFYLSNLASGRTHIEIEKAGLASLREEINITAGFTTPIDRLKYRLSPGSTLTVSLEGAVGGPEPAELWLAPGAPNRLSTYPFWKLNPIKIYPGQTQVIRDLPSDLIRVQTFRTGALAEPESRNVNLRASQAASLTISLTSAPTISGVVLENGVPVVGAPVTMVAPDEVQAALRHYRQPAEFLESAFLPLSPNARQTTTTDDRGRFVLTAWADSTPARYLSASSPTGDAVGLRLITLSDTEVSLDLYPREADRGVAMLETQARFQGLPIEWRVNGEPRDGFTLPAGETLRFEGLREGKWRVHVRWQAEEVYDERGVSITREGTELKLQLPQDAIVGQDREAWLRAGRDYPF